MPTFKKPRTPVNEASRPITNFTLQQQLMELDLSLPVLQDIDPRAPQPRRETIYPTEASRHVDTLNMPQNAQDKLKREAEEAETYWKFKNQVGRNIERGAVNTLKVGTDMILPAAAAAATGGMMSAVYGAAAPLAPTFGSALAGFGKAALAGVAADQLYYQAGFEGMGDAFDIKNPVGRFIGNMATPGAAVFSVGAQGAARPHFKAAAASTGDDFARVVRNADGSDVIPAPAAAQPARTFRKPAPNWQKQEMPGLHLKSTMDGGAIEKIVEQRTGLINVEQALNTISKEAGGADKVTIIREAMGGNIPQKMDYNDFRKTVQDALISLEKQFTEHKANYGINRLGYTSGEVELSNLRSLEDAYNNINRFNYKDIDAYELRKAELKSQIDIMKKSKPIENQSMILGNKNKFGRGSSAHDNPEETLGHIHFLRDAESPDVLTVTQIQSDAFQGTNRTMPKSLNMEFEKRSLVAMENVANRHKEMAKNARQVGPDRYLLNDGSIVDKNVLDEMGVRQDQVNIMKKAEIENFTQKSLLDKNHQERYLQETVQYAAERGDVNSVRVPTSETAAKVQGYNSIGDADDFLKKWNDLSPEDRIEELAEMSSYDKTRLDRLLEGKIKGGIYTEEHETILRKYQEYPKMIKKLYGQDARTVTDGKGNTWYEFDIPKSFKEGKGQIKAFSVTGGAALISTQEQKQDNKPKFRTGGFINKTL